MRYFFTQDDSSHWYMIPEDLRKQWQKLILKLECAADDDEANDTAALIDTEFGQYMMRGGLSHYSFLDPQESPNA